MTNEELARKTAEKILKQPSADNYAIDVNGEEGVAEFLEMLQPCILSCIQEAVKEKDEIMELLTYSYRVGGLKESVDGALRAGSDVDVPISGGLIKRAAEALATEGRPPKDPTKGSMV